MKNRMFGFALVAGLASLPTWVSAAMTISEAKASVEAMLAEGSAAPEIIEALINDGRSLREATATAVDASVGDNQIDLARAGICASQDDAQAQKVGEAAINMVVSDVGAVDDIKGAIEGYLTGACGLVVKKELPPSGLYQTTQPPSGGGQTIVGGGIGGGVLPPTIGGPVSPAS